MIVKSIKRPWIKSYQGTVYRTVSTFDYTNPKWRALRAWKLSVNPFCECDQCVGKKTPADMVDHKRRIEDGGDPYDKNNLQSMKSHPCHDRKRAREKNEKYAK